MIEFLITQLPDTVRLSPNTDYKKPNLYDMSDADKIGLYKYWMERFLSKYGLSTTLKRVDYQYVKSYCSLLDKNIPIKKIDDNLTGNYPLPVKYRIMISGYIGTQIFCPYNSLKLY